MRSATTRSENSMTTNHIGEPNELIEAIYPKAGRCAVATGSKGAPLTRENEAETLESYIIALRDKAALIANNAPEETERFIGRQMILLCEQALMIRNRTVAPSNADVSNGGNANR